MPLLNTPLSPISMIEHGSAIITPLMGLVFLSSISIGLWMVGMGIWRVFRFGQIGVEDPKLDAKSVFFSILIGAALVGMAWVMGSSLLTFTGSAKPSPLAYTGPGGQDVATAIVDIMHFLQLLGVIWFAHGLRMMYRLGTNNPRQGEFHGKSWTHMLGGLGLIDIAGVAMALAHLAGTQLPF
jgi:intracellular multiplication protein IcmC